LTLDQTAKPRKEYERRLEARRWEAASHLRRFRHVGVVRLSMLAASLVLAWLAFRGISPWWLLPPITVFLALAIVQQRITTARRRCERAAALYTEGIARLNDAWAGKGSKGERFLDPAHPYAQDLDLFGSGSLFELLSRARTRVGEETLAHWLLSPAPPEIILARHGAVLELRPQLDLREDLALLGEGIHTGSEALPLTDWAAKAPWLIPGALRFVALLLGAIALLALVLGFAGFGWTFFLVAILLGQTVAFSFRGRTQEVISSVAGPGRDLSLLSEILRRLERERFTSPHLSQLRAALDVEGSAPSEQIARLNRLIELLDSRRNMFFAPFALILLWPMQCAIAIERWRQKSGPAVARWLAAVGEFEALSSLAGYSYEHPHDPFPEFSDGAPSFDGDALGHPLLPETRTVRSSVSLADGLRVLIVSGSNMSGKSTLLRTVGTNTVLALAGAPVRAQRLRLSPLQVGASIRIQDSLQAGASRFYAEITRLRQILELTKSAPSVLFLLDEMLHGTNSHDRRIGAEGVLRALVERSAIGLVTTHDLALTLIVDELRERAANVHFEDHLEGGRMSFDYLLRPGVLQRSNALELMRSVGLEV
jgi:hypothetical protein